MSVSLLSRAPCAPLPHRDRVRRVVLLCASFGRNAAYYRAGWGGEAQPLLSERHPDTSFWRQVNANFLDMAVLDCASCLATRRKPRAPVWENTTGGGLSSTHACICLQNSMPYFGSPLIV